MKLIICGFFLFLNELNFRSKNEDPPRKDSSHGRSSPVITDTSKQKQKNVRRSNSSSSPGMYEFWQKLFNDLIKFIGVICASNRCDIFLM